MNLTEITLLNSPLEPQKRINYQSCAIEVIKNLRGTMNQRELSQRLGYTFNQLGKWESGVTQIKWYDFIYICLNLNIPIESNFKKLFLYSEEPFTPSNALIALSKNLNLNQNLKNKYRIKLTKWTQGIGSPDFAEVLEIIDEVPTMLIAFLSSFVDCQKVKILSSLYAQYITGIELISQDPVCAYINAALQTQEYKELRTHNDLILANHATCSIEDLQRLLPLMLNYGAITFDGQKYYPNAFDFTYSSIPHVKLRGLTKYTTGLAFERYPLVPLKKTSNPSSIKQNPGMGSVRVNALSHEAAQKISDIISELHAQIGKVVEEDINQPKNNVQVIIIHSFPSTANSPLVKPDSQG